MPEQKMIEVSRGDLGVKFHTIDGLDAAYNRPVNQARVKEYGKNVGALGISHVTLVQAAPGSYYIVDGQHRIAAISQYGNGHPVFMPATIYTVKEIGDAGRSVSQFISDLNKGRPFSTSDRLAVFSQDSQWPFIFAQHGIEIAHGYGRGRLTWASVLRGSLMAQDCIERSRLTMTKDGTPETIEALWANGDREQIEAAARAMAWWLPVATAATSQKVYTFFSAPALTLAMVAYHENRDRPAALAGTLSSVSHDPFLAAVKGTANVAAMIAILRSCNYKRTTNRLTVFGVDGRGVGVDGRGE